MTGKKLLVADDSLTIQKVIRLALSNEGYEIQAVSDGNDAIQQISLFRPDVILIDVSLPGKSAFEVKRAINEHSDLDEVRFVLMSSAFERVDEVQAEEVKFHGRLTKPFDPAHLRQVLTEALAQVTAKRMEPTVDIATHMFQQQSPPPLPKEAMPPLPMESMPPLPSMPSTPPLPPQEEVELEQEWMKPMAPTSEPLDFPPPLPSQASGPDADIRQLTESTMNMSGYGSASSTQEPYEDFQWNVSEPSLKPSASMTEPNPSSFELEPASSASATSMPPFRPEFDFSDDEPSLGDLPPPLPGDSSVASPSDYYRDHAQFSQPQAAAPQVSTQEIEAMVRKQLQQLLPEIAERLIKQEIHRMLSES